MKITRDVITDLLPVYHSGEASADTVELVEDFFAADHEFAALARTNIDRWLESVEPDETPKEVEKMALEKTKKLLQLRANLMGLAIFFTLLPFSFHVGDETGFRWIFLGNPTVVGFYAALALIGWMGYVVLRFRTRTSQL